MWHSIRRIYSLNDPGWGRGQGPGGGGEGPKRPGNDGPPDLDELWREFNRRLNGLFGRRGGGGSGGPPPASGPPGGRPTMRGAGAGLGMLALVALLLWLASGFYIVPEGHAAAILRFGKFMYLNDHPGFTWRIPYPIETQEMVNVQQLRQIEVGYRGNVKNKVLRESLMLTQDQSIVDMQFAVQYRVSDPVAYLFNNNPGAAPEDLVRQAAETAMREVVGGKGIDQVLYEEKESVAKDARTLMQTVLDRYKAGITVVDVTIQQAQPPEQVQAAFEDANKAAQDRERSINEGRAYANDVIPRARGAAARLGQEADGYRQSLIATAEGDASRFRQILTEYAKAPQVTRERMYIETMQQVFSNTSKVYIDAKAPGNLLYLPLDKLIEQGVAASNVQAAAAAAPATAVGTPVPSPAVPPHVAAPAERPADAGTHVPGDTFRNRDALRSRDRDAGR